MQMIPSPLAGIMYTLASRVWQGAALLNKVNCVSMSHDALLMEMEGGGGGGGSNS